LRLAAVDLKAQVEIEGSGGGLLVGDRQSYLFQIWLRAGAAQEFLHQGPSYAFSAVGEFDVDAPDVSFAASLLFARAVESRHAGGLSVDECCQHEAFAGTETKPGGRGLRSHQSVGIGRGGKSQRLGLESFEAEVPE
jgi:hypothetical protein